MAVVLALGRGDREPGLVHAVVVDHVVGPDPLELVVLVEAQLGHRGLVPPVPLLPTAAAPLGVVGRCHGHRALACVNVEVAVGRDEGRVGPVGLDAAALRGPVVGVPYRAVHAHGLVLRVRDASVLQIGVGADRSLVHKKPTRQKTKDHPIVTSTQSVVLQ